MAESTCAGCGLAFTGLTAFDRHQRHPRGADFVECVDPRKLGMTAKIRTAAGRRRTVWGWPDSGTSPFARESVDGGPETGDAA